MTAPRKAVPTSVRLSAGTREALASEARRQRRPQSFIIEDAIARYLEAGSEPRPEPTEADRLAALATIRAMAERHGAGRSAEEIDAEIRWLRGDD